MRLLNFILTAGCALSLILLAEASQAQTSFLNIEMDEEQTAKPAPAEVATPTPPPAKNYPQCASGRYTTKGQLAGEMIEDVLGFQSPFSKKLVDKSGQNGFILTDSGDLQVRATVEGTTYDLAGSICQAADGLIVKLVHPMATKFIKVRPVASNKVRITQYEGTREDASTSLIFTGYSRGVR